MISNKLTRAIDAFRADYEQYVEKDVRTVPVSALTQAEQDEFWRRDGELHPSGFPFCGLRAAYERLVRAEDPELEKNFGADYYLPVGTATHSALQKWMGHSKRIIGDWKCLNSKCGKLHTFQVEPKLCSCKYRGTVKFEYEELGGKYGKKVSWHTDGVFQKAEGPNNYWVVDYKTTSEYALELHRKNKNVFPYLKNRFQIETYIPLIEQKYDIKLQGWMLHYAARDNPNKTWKTITVGGTITEERREELLQRLIVADNDFVRTLKVREFPIKVFKSVMPTKLCEDRDFYDHFVYDKWDPCPLESVCWNKKKLQAKLSKTIEESKE